MTATSYIERTALLRTLVGYLGEREQYAWWDTSSLSSVGQRFLVRVFPRTALLAGVETTTQAARALHDERIGHLRVFHLFRLPATTEEEVRDYLAQAGTAELQERIASGDTALATLQELAGTSGEAGSPGPVRVGTLQALRHGQALDRMAQMYHSAFVQRGTCFPYLTEA